ncbi:MAG: hypothetical protein ACM3JD_16635 [Rudaea sp.]
MIGQERMRESLIERMEHWGYYLLPAPHEHCPGYSGLLVAIRAIPTRRHYDPESIGLDILLPPGRIETMAFGRETDVDKGRRVCPGSMTLCDRRGKQEMFFSFGGIIESIHLPDETIFSLRSNAPILWLTRSGETVADVLVAEFGHLVGEMRARCKDRDEGFFRRMARIDPLVLYTASLSSIFAEYESEQPLRDASPDFHLMLHDEKEWLEETGQWPDNPETLEQLLVC